MVVRARRLNDEEVIKHQLALSDRHRLWGTNCPMVDIDFLVTEYDHAKPKALIEYKHEKANVDFTNLNNLGMAPQSYEALNKLATQGNIPFFVVRYNDTFSIWNITPMNKLATIWCQYLKRNKTLLENEYVDFLYILRERESPNDIQPELIVAQGDPPQ